MTSFDLLKQFLIYKQKKHNYTTREQYLIIKQMRKELNNIT